MERIGRPERFDDVDAAMELDAVREDAHAHIARLRLAMQQTFWSNPEIARMHRVVLRELERFDAQITGSEGRAA